MKKRHFLTIGLLSLLAASCTQAELNAPDGLDVRPSKGFYAIIEDQPDENGTKTFTDETLHVFWNADDRVTYFDNITYGEEYRFTGEDHDNGGHFEPVSSGIIGGEDLGGMYYAVYPYQKSTTISHSGVISYTFPATQNYAQGSFGRGANVMVAKANDNKLRFKNVGGYLSFKLYGSDVSVSSVILKSNDGETLAGPATIDMSDGIPSLSLDPENGTDEVRLYCADPVVLGEDKDHYTEFWFVLPPMTFSSKGFTLIVATPDGEVYTRSAPMELSIERNQIRRMAPLKVVPGATETLSLDDVVPQEGINYKTSYDESSRTFTVTMPTVTDFSNLILNYGFVGDQLLANGEEIKSGVTAIDASSPVTLTVIKGTAEKRYTLVARNTGLPVVRITTEGFDLQDLIDDEDHVNWRGTSKDTPNENATFRIEYPDGTPGLLNGAKPAYEVATMIRGRGNASWDYPKKPFAIKLDKKRSVLGMPEHKRWVLLANWKDRTLLRNDAVFWLSRQSGLPYTVRGQFVELEFNGEHMGNYYLCEQIKVDDNRVNITKLDLGEDGQTVPENYTGGYLMEIDNNFDEVNRFESSSPFKLKYMFQDPDGDGEALPDVVFNYMKNYITTLETKIKSAGTSDYKDYLDIDSAIWFMLINEMANNSDFYNTDGWGWSTYRGPHSTFLYKEKDGKLFFGPVWDFDYHVFVPSYSNQWLGATQKNYYYNYLYQDSDFKERMHELWFKDDYNRRFLGVTDYIDEMARYIRLSEEFDAEMWWTGEGHQTQNGEENMTFDQAVDNIKNGFLTKWTFINNNLDKLSYQK